VTNKDWDLHRGPPNEISEPARASELPSGDSLDAPVCIHFRPVNAVSL